MELYHPLNNAVRELVQEFDQIPEERKQLLRKLAQYTLDKKSQGEPVQFNFICTHNSRRSHLSQLWAQSAAAFYDLTEAFCFSGGTEATAFNPRAVLAMKEAGFMVEVLKEGDNPLYEVKFSDEVSPLKAWSKRFDDPANPVAGFCAVMTCSDADQKCPLISGADLRLPLTFEDPKNFDDTPQEKQKYRERSRQIGREMLYAFSIV